MIKFMSVIGLYYLSMAGYSIPEVRSGNIGFSNIGIVSIVLFLTTMCFLHVNLKSADSELSKKCAYLDRYHLLCNRWVKYPIVK